MDFTQDKSLPDKTNFSSTRILSSLTQTNIQSLNFRKYVTKDIK